MCVPGGRRRWLMGWSEKAKKFLKRRQGEKFDLILKIKTQR